MDPLALALTPQVGPRRLMQVLQKKDLSPEAVEETLGREIGAEYRKVLKQGRAEQERERAEGLGIRVIGLWEGGYPEALRQLESPPSVLYLRGSIPPFERSLGVVGTRRASVWASNWARKVALELAGAGVSVVSGLARGIDTAAHQGNLEGGADTLGVLGSALDQIYPPENRALAQRMSLLSEFPLGTPPQASLFPRRNRLIAALARSVLVVEAGIKSGSLITAKFALELGRDVLAVPGRPSDPFSEGCNRLIQDGAGLVLGAEDVLGSLGLRARPKPALELAGPEAALHRALLELGAALPDDLAQAVGLPPSEVLAHLTLLELKGLVLALPGGRYGVGA
ncbi:MAG: DNA-protecting protein DprA [Meiothermus sp.]